MSNPLPPSSALPVFAGTMKVAPADVAPTRLQLRWTEDDTGEASYRCHYELVLALDSSDIRREQYGPRGGRQPDRVNQVVPIRSSGRNSLVPPCEMDGHLYYDAPRYDGKHAEWDAAKLGGLPVYVITLDGVVLQDAPPTRVTPAPLA
jgi:hypothetical protein